MDNNADLGQDEAGTTSTHTCRNPEFENESSSRHELPSAPCGSLINPSNIGTSSSDNPFPIPPDLNLRPTTPPRETQRDWTMAPPTDDKGKGKCKDTEPGSSTSTGRCRLLSLPPEIIDNILSYLSPIDLTSVSATCRLLYSHATADQAWQKLVQDFVPGVKVTSSFPFQSFRDLFKAHDPHWFLPKHKIWFSDGGLAGRLVLARFDQRRGCIEGYQVVAVSNRKSLQPWQADSQVMIQSFEPKVKLHLDKPILHLGPHRVIQEQEEVTRVGGVTFVRLRGVSSDVDFPTSGEASGSNSVPSDILHHPPSRFQADFPMNVGLDGQAFSHFMLARPLDHADMVERSTLPFPYGNLWPPPVIPAHHRVAGVDNTTTRTRKALELPKPTSRQEVSDQAFRIRNGLQLRAPGGTGRLPTPGTLEWEELVRNGPSALLSILMTRPLGLNVGEEISTYSTLDPALYTPTPEKPYRGIWVGDYSSHGCEFLLINQPDDPLDRFDPNTIQQRESDSDEAFAKRKHDETVYRGRLEAIKLTGDPNIPRGEYTFVADDLGEAGFEAVVQHEPFTGTRVVKSKGHIANTGFDDDQYIESQLLLISHDRLAQYWVGFGHISFFERVDIDKLLVPE